MGKQVRPLYFSPDRSLGQLTRVFDESAYRYGEELGEKLGQAQGTVAVDGRGHVHLAVAEDADLSPLEDLPHDALFEIDFPVGYAHEDQLLHLGHFTGLLNKREILALVHC